MCVCLSNCYLCFCESPFFGEHWPVQHEEAGGREGGKEGEWERVGEGWKEGGRREEGDRERGREGGGRRKIGKRGREGGREAEAVCWG